MTVCCGGGDGAKRQLSPGMEWWGQAEGTGWGGREQLARVKAEGGRLGRKGIGWEVNGRDLEG